MSLPKWRHCIELLLLNKLLGISCIQYLCTCFFIISKLTHTRAAIIIQPNYPKLPHVKYNYIILWRYIIWEKVVVRSDFLFKTMSEHNYIFAFLLWPTHKNLQYAEPISCCKFLILIYHITVFEHLPKLNENRFCKRCIFNILIDVYLIYKWLSASPQILTSY